MIHLNVNDVRVGNNLLKPLRFYMGIQARTSSLSPSFSSYFFCFLSYILAAPLPLGQYFRIRADSRWNHFPNSELGKMHDDLLRAELGLPEVSYVFQYISH
jgi:hypothetical protein